MKKLFYITLILILSGCSSNNYPVTYKSDIPSALLVCGDEKNFQTYWTTQTTLSYKLNKKQIETRTGVLEVTPCYAIWKSGAIKDFHSEFDLNKFPNGVEITAIRPNVKGLEQDLQIATFIQNKKFQEGQLEMMREQAAAASQQAQQYQLNSILNQNLYYRYWLVSNIFYNHKISNKVE